MIRVFNYLLGVFLQLAAHLIVKRSPSLQNKLSLIKSEILRTISEKSIIPSNLAHSVIVIEDKRYYSHSGIDFYSIIRAVAINITSTRIQGASTIPQQLIRNITGERKIELKRKLQEIILSSLISKLFSKKEILSAYFTLYKFAFCKGITAFCEIEKYRVDQLNDIQSAEIAARFKYPSLNKKNYSRYLKRVRIIETKMLSCRKTDSYFKYLNSDFKIETEKFTKNILEFQMINS